MTLLSIWEFGWGGLLAITIAVLGGSIAMFLYAVKISKSGGQTQATPGNGKGTTYDNERTPIYKISFFKGSVVLFIAWVIIMFSIARSYAPDKPHTVTPLEDGRKAAGE